MAPELIQQLGEDDRASSSIQGAAATNRQGRVWLLVDALGSNDQIAAQHPSGKGVGVADVGKMEVTQGEAVGATTNDGDPL